MKIYIDVTNLMIVDFLTGIQRVVREVVIRLLEMDGLEVVLLKSNNSDYYFYCLNSKNFLVFFKECEGKKTDIGLESTVYTKELEPNAIFFEIDSVWNSPYRRSVLLQELKDRGLKIVTYIYDTIPITHPQFCHTNTLYRFMDYFGSNLQYADAFIVSTQSVLDSINEISDQLGVRRVPGYVSWLGSDFKVNDPEQEVDEKVKSFISQEKKYILTVGTIEPRKNHKVLLDAIDSSLSEEISLVFAGRIGWNVKNLEQRIREHGELENRFFFFEKLNDASIDLLYKNAYLVAFPTFDEGFGLPMIEAFERGVPVIASDCKVLREVGGKRALYFNGESPEEFSRVVNQLLKKPEQYLTLKNMVKTFVPFTWDQTTDRIANVLLNFSKEKISIKTELKQMVILSARCQDVCNTLPHVEYFMPFIKELVLCCPDGMKDEFKKKYYGKLKVKIITDNMLLGGCPLPQDHQTRNFYLRSLIMYRKEVDPVFIMSDDDYRPLEMITPDLYIKDKKYKIYYCHSLRTWRGMAGNMTSYDLGMFNTLKFLEEYQYPVLQYSSHMPQIIDKERYQEFLESHKGVEFLGIDEWSSYFNWLQYMHPQLVEVKPYLTMCWPGAPTDWKLDVLPKKYMFENYYEALYEKNKIFEGFSSVFYDGIENENKEKRNLFKNRQKLFEAYDNVYKNYINIYKQQYREIPSFSIIVGKDIELHMPIYLILPYNGFLRIPVQMCTENGNSGTSIRISYYFENKGRKLFAKNNIVAMERAENMQLEIPMFANFNCRGKVTLYFKVNYAGKEYLRMIETMLVNADDFGNVR